MKLSSLKPALLASTFFISSAGFVSAQSLDADSLQDEILLANTDAASHALNPNLDTGLDTGALEEVEPLSSPETEKKSAEQESAEKESEAAPKLSLNSENHIQDLTPLVDAGDMPNLNADIEARLVGEVAGVWSAEKSAIAEFYAARGYQPYFVVNENANLALDQAISLAYTQGLPQSRYDMPEAGGDMALAEIQAAARLIRYARDMERGIVLPRSLGSEFDYEPQGRGSYDIITSFENASDKPAFFLGLEPNDPAYPVLKAQLARIHAVIGQDVEEPIKIPTGNTLRLGDQDPRIAYLRDRLAQLGFEADYSAVTGSSAVADGENLAQMIADEMNLDAQDNIAAPETTLESASDQLAHMASAISVEDFADFNALPAEGINASQRAEFNPHLFDEKLEAMVLEFQGEAGLTADGIVGPATLSYLNSAPKDHMRSILIAMERHRWGPQNRNGRQIYVNIANFMAEVRDDNEKVFETVVVVGKNKQDFRTPEFNDTMTHLIVNPKWNVPQSISVREYLPKIKRDPTVLARNNIVMRIKGSGQVVTPQQLDMSQFTVDDFPFLLQQQSGDGNALGNVKFMFPNKHNIYLHDTPAKQYFGRSIRTYSHGCVRVRDPEDFATLLLSPQINNPREKYRSYRATGKERRVNLATPVPIHLTYFTAYLNNSGTISYMPDSYGRDQLLASALRDKGLEI